MSCLDPKPYYTASDSLNSQSLYVPLKILLFKLGNISVLHTAKDKNCKEVIVATNDIDFTFIE